MKSNKALRLTVYLIAIMSLMWAASGCWSRREIEDLAFVMAIGVDRSPSGNIQMTAQFAKPEAMGSAEGPKSQEKPFWVATTEGHTMFEAFRNLGYISPKRPYLPHNNFYIFGEDLFREMGIKPFLDLINRDPEPRLTARISVVKGATAKDLLQAEFEGMPMSAVALRGIMNHLTKAWGTIHETTIRDFLDRMESEGIEPIAMGAEVIPFEPDIEIEGEVSREQIKARATLGGTAVFKGDYLVGWLDSFETRGLNWILGKVNNTVVEFPHPGAEDKRVSVEILRATGSFEVQVEDEDVRAFIEVNAVGNLGCIQEPVDFIKQPEVWTQFEKGAEKAIEDEIARAVAALQRLGSDAVGFGQYIFRRKPKEWESLKHRWDEIFPAIGVDIDVTVHLRGMGVVLKSAETK